MLVQRYPIIVSGVIGTSGSDATEARPGESQSNSGQAISDTKESKLRENQT